MQKKELYVVVVFIVNEGGDMCYRLTTKCKNDGTCTRVTSCVKENQ